MGERGIPKAREDGVMRWSRGEKFGAVIIALLLVMIVVVSWLATEDANNKVAAEDAWQHSVHTCPVCGWEGYPGHMTIVDQGFLRGTLYYCPMCGALLHTRSG
jgi:predicted RNA-binding Zn-ribbon protein involved in translation (DUF1610 family)